ncbi:MAG: GDP-mannose 4,6-dehydratase [Acidobacteria bacterium]|nr:GDP-mannose 4,6-dehydratase [Acidobacteriota bacterium]
MRALITGIGGFVGGHMSTLLLREGFEVWGIDRLPVFASAANAAVANRVTAIELGDVCDPAFTDHVVKAARPTHVFHFAWEFGDRDRANGSTATDRNVLGLTALLQSIGASAMRTRVLIASSSAVYGAPARHPEDEGSQPRSATACGSDQGPATRQPIDENAPLEPTNAYGISKAAIETAAGSFRSVNGMNIVVTRTFNLIGPGMPPRLFAGSLAAQIAAAERGAPSTIKVGRLDSSRDYVDVRDAVRAYLALASQSTTDVRDAVRASPAQDSAPDQRLWIFNVCTGASHSCREIADEMLALARVPVTLDHDGSRLQSGDIDYQQGSATRLRQLTGWTPTIAFSTSVRDTLDHARKRGV